MEAETTNEATFLPAPIRRRYDEGATACSKKRSLQNTAVSNAGECGYVPKSQDVDNHNNDDLRQYNTDFTEPEFEPRICENEESASDSSCHEIFINEMSNGLLSSKYEERHRKPHGRRNAYSMLSLSKRSLRCLHEVIAINILGPVVWLSTIRKEYGMQLMMLLFASQHILKGVVQQFQASSVMWLLREYRVSGPQMQVYVSMANSAWALKPMIGVVSDLLPIFGYRKAPYVMLTSFIGIICTTAIGVSSKTATTVSSVVMCLFGMQLQASTSDLLTEATYSEQIQKKPALGPDLISFVWGGITIGNMTAICFVSWLITNFGPRSVFLGCIVPSSAILYPTIMNYFQERAYSIQQLEQVRATFMKQWEVLFLCCLMTCLTITLTIVGSTVSSHETQFHCGVSVLIVLLPAFNLLLRPEIARVNSFFMLQAALSMNISGATFYFYTDAKEQFPEGPHFSPWFFTTCLGLMASVMSLVGLSTYTRYMKYWTYRSLLIFSNLVVTMLALLDVVMFRRENLKWGIPDKYFCIGSSICSMVVRQWQWMPAIVMLSQLCPTGMEATMFALLAGCMNLGNQIADFLGAYLLASFGVHPTGALNESKEFDNLWRASFCATLTPAITISLIPLLVPKGRQTEKLLMSHGTSATFGSPWSKLFGSSRHEESGEGLQRIPRNVQPFLERSTVVGQRSGRASSSNEISADRRFQADGEVAQLHRDSENQWVSVDGFQGYSPPHSGRSSGGSTPTYNDGSVGSAPVKAEMRSGR